MRGPGRAGPGCPAAGARPGPGLRMGGRRAPRWPAGSPQPHPGTGAGVQAAGCAASRQCYRCLHPRHAGSRASGPGRRCQLGLPARSCGLASCPPACCASRGGRATPAGTAGWWPAACWLLGMARRPPVPGPRMGWLQARPPGPEARAAEASRLPMSVPRHRRCLAREGPGRLSCLASPLCLRHRGRPAAVAAAYRHGRGPQAGGLCPRLPVGRPACGGPH